MRCLQPVPAQSSLRNRAQIERQRDCVWAYGRRLLRIVPAECDVHGTGERIAGGNLVKKTGVPLIRPLVYVNENLTRAYAESLGAPVIPCGCSQKTGTVRRSIRDMFAEIENDHPFLKETLLSAMGNIETSRMLDTRFLDLDGNAEEAGFFTEDLVTLQFD